MPSPMSVHGRHTLTWLLCLTEAVMNSAGLLVQRSGDDLDLPDLDGSLYEWGPDCFGTIEMSRAAQNQRFGNGRLVSSYPDLQSLCAAKQWGGDESSNLGGVCVMIPGKPPFPGLVSGRPYGDPHLYGDVGLRTRCVVQCKCDFPLGWTPEWLEAASATSFIRNVRGTEISFPDSSTTITDSNGNLHVNKDGTTFFYENTCLSSKSDACINNKQTSFQSCGLQQKCKDFSCGQNAIQECKCIASQFNVARGVFGALACGIVTKGRRGRLGGRMIEDSIACPCNMSYVSNSCCFSDSKLVWENPEMKLGELAADVGA